MVHGAGAPGAHGDLAAAGVLRPLAPGRRHCQGACTTVAPYIGFKNLYC